MTMIEHLTKDSFKRKVFDYQNERMYRFEGERPVVIDFYTNWCVPCKTIAPILEELQREYEGKVDIYKVDSDMEKELVKAFNVRSIPTLMFGSGGRPAASGMRGCVQRGIETFL